MIGVRCVTLSMWTDRCVSVTSCLRWPGSVTCRWRNRRHYVTGWRDWPRHWRGRTQTSNTGTSLIILYLFILLALKPSSPVVASEYIHCVYPRHQVLSPAISHFLFTTPPRVLHIKVCKHGSISNIRKTHANNSFDHFSSGELHELA